MKIKTIVLQDLVAKAVKAAGNNKLIPITNLLGIEAIDNKLNITTTDGTNYLTVSAITDEIIEESFYTTVNADLFCKLVGKTTSEYIILTNNDKFVEFIGNGTYKLDLAINEEGKLVKFPVANLDIATDINTTTFEISTKLFIDSLMVAENSLAKTLELPVLRSYYVGDRIITTDRQMMTCVNSPIFTTPILISTETGKLISLFTDETISVIISNNSLFFKSSNIILSTKPYDGIESYPVKSLDGLLNLQYDSCININKQLLLDILDRMSLFTGQFNKNGVYLNITENTLEIISQQSNAIEILDLITETESTAVKYNCLIDIDMFKAQIMNISTDIITLYYGQKSSIKLVDGTVIKIICLMHEVA